MVPTKPCDETRPQERGFNKRYRFLELRLGDFPEDRLCLAGGLCTAGTRLPLSSSTVSAAATLYLSLTTWKYAPPPHPPPRAQCPYSLAVSSATSPAVVGKAGPEGASNSLWDAWAELDQAGPPGYPETLPPLSSLPLTGALGNQAWRRFASVCLVAKWTQISHRYHLFTR